MALGKRLLGTEGGRATVAFLVAQYVRLVHRTARWQVINRDAAMAQLAQSGAVIGITWHSRLMMIPYIWQGPGKLHLLASRHGDGELIARVLRHFGLVMLRGSTKRRGRDRDKGGAAALRQMLNLLKQGHSVGLTPDGPRGPAMRLSEGVITLARLSGAPIIPISISTSRYHAFNSWDRFRLALPFSRAAMVYGEAITVPRDLDTDGQEQARVKVEAALMAVTERADRLVGTVTVEAGCEATP